MDLNQWIDSYRAAWEERDSAAAGRLFAEHALYRSNIFEEPHVGRQAIEKYWEEVTAAQREVVVRMGSPVGRADRANVEWWTTMLVGGEELTLTGCLILAFDESGYCVDLREYWQTAESILEPPEGWGS